MSASIEIPKLKLLPFTFGCDPEFALYDKVEKRYVSAHNLIPGTKAAPHKVDGGAIQVDGVMVEFNIDPASSSNSFVKNIEKVLTELRKHLPEDRYDFIFDPIVVYDKEYFESLPNEVKELGCSPDFDAWREGGINQSPEPVPFLPTMRTCSGHIHIGWTENADVTDPSHLWDCRMMIKNLDCCLFEGMQEKDHDRIRRMMYGKLGAFRPKPYGVEWRVPSNFWMKDAYSRKTFIDAVALVVNEFSFRKSAIPTQYKPYPETSLYLSGMYENHKSQRIAIGSRIAPTSGKVGYDLNLDIPFSVGGKYTPPPNGGKGLKDYVLI